MPDTPNHISVLLDLTKADAGKRARRKGSQPEVVSQIIILAYFAAVTPQIKFCDEKEKIVIFFKSKLG